MPADHNDIIRRQFAQHVLKLVNDSLAYGYHVTGLVEDNSRTRITFESDRPIQFIDGGHVYGTRKLTVTFDAEYEQKGP